MSITREWGDYVALLGLVNIFDKLVAAVSSLGEGLSIIYPSNHSQEEADFDSIAKATFIAFSKWKQKQQMYSKN